MKDFLINKFYGCFQKNPDYFYFSPGRINIIGEHIDYNGGKVLPVAISLGIYGAVSYNDDEMVNVVSNLFDEIVSFNIKNLNMLSSGFSRYIIGIIASFNEYNFLCTKGFNLYLFSTLPMSSGLSSSASLELLVSHILNDYMNFSISDFDLVNISVNAERKYVGVNCGIMDQFAIGMSKKDKAILLKTGTIEYQYIDLKLNSNCFLILNTNKKRDLVDSKYNQRFEECKVALKKLNNIYKENRIALCDYTFSELEKSYDKLDSISYRRARHVITENIRVSKAVDALIKEDYKLLGKLLYESHESLKDDYEVTGSNLDTIYYALKECLGVYGGRMCGAGFGGCAIALVEEEYVDNIIKKVQNIYFNEHHLQLDCYIVKSSSKTERIFYEN